MKISKDEYRCWFFINQDQQKRPFETDEQAAADVFLGFLANKNYGSGLRVFRFDIYVERKINLGKHRDSIYSGYAHLSANIDYQIFVESNSEARLRLLLNAALILCTYLISRLVLPKEFDGAGFVKDFTEFLKATGLLIPASELTNVVIKPFDTTRFNFVITTTAEVNDEEIHYDLITIQDFLNNELSGKTFGSSVREFDFGYEVFDSLGKIKSWKETAEIRRYGRKHKNLLVVKQFDYRHLKGKAQSEQFEMLKAKILEAIDDVSKIKQLPRDFAKSEFLEFIDKAMDKYLVSADKVPGY